MKHTISGFEYSTYIRSLTLVKLFVSISGTLYANIYMVKVYSVGTDSSPPAG